MKIDDLYLLEFSMQKRVSNNALTNINLQQAIYYITEDSETQTNIKSLHNFIVSQAIDVNNPEHKKRYQEKKVELLSAFTPSGTFRKPTISELNKYSQIVQVDFDDLSDVQMEKLMRFVKNEKSVVFSFISPGRRGRKVFHLVKPIDGVFEDKDTTLAEWELRQIFHLKAFNQIKTLYKRQGVCDGFDDQIHDLSRRCYFSHDQNCYINEFEIEPLEIEFDEAEAITEIKTEVKTEDLVNGYLSHLREEGLIKHDKKGSIDVLDDIVNWLTTNGKTITSTYNQWYKVIFALRANLPENIALNYAKLFSQMDKNYNEADLIEKFKQDVDISKSPTIGSIYYYAKEMGYEPSKGLKKKGGIKSNIQLELFVRQLAKYEFNVRFNVFIDILEIQDRRTKAWQRLEDNHTSKIRTSVVNYEMTTQDIHHSLITIAPLYDPVKVLMNSIPKWDGANRLTDLANTLSPVDISIAETFIKRWMIGVLSNISDSESYNENVLILQGEQGKGKTRWVRTVIESILVHADIMKNRYFVEKALDPTNKDDLKLICTSFVVFYDELSGVVSTKADINAFKNLTSSKAQTIRKPYERNEKELSRKASIIATVNDREFLRDTENRRFWVIGSNNIRGLDTVDLIQVWAQIKHLYNQGEKQYLNSKESIIVKEYLRQFEAKSTEEELILSYVHEDVSQKLTATEIKSKIEKLEETKLNMTAANFGKILSKYFKGAHTRRGTVYPVDVWYQGHVKESTEKNSTELSKQTEDFFGNQEPLRLPDSIFQQQNSHGVSKLGGRLSATKVGANPPYD